MKAKSRLNEAMCRKQSLQRVVWDLVFCLSSYRHFCSQALKCFYCEKKAKKQQLYVCPKNCDLRKGFYYAYECQWLRQAIHFSDFLFSGSGVGMHQQAGMSMSGSMMSPGGGAARVQGSMGMSSTMVNTAAFQQRTNNAFASFGTVGK